MFRLLNKIEDKTINNQIDLLSLARFRPYARIPETVRVAVFSMSDATLTLPMFLNVNL